MDLICEERASDSPLVELVWRHQTEADYAFLSMAESHYGLVVTHYNGRTTLTVRGPESRATPARALAGAETFGIMFKAGVFIADWPATTVMNRRDVTLPGASDHRFWLRGAAWQFPDFDNAEVFVRRLLRADLLIHEPLVSGVLQQRLFRDISLRTVQRRFAQATGLTQGTIVQIDRARYAARRLIEGSSILDTVVEAGYYDQPHLTRSLKAYIGLTPAQLLNPDRTTSLSFLYKNTARLLNHNVNSAFTTPEQREEKIR
jgi:AraC-like DNA-binding protein